MKSLSVDTITFREETRWDFDCEDEYQFWPRTMWIDPGQSTGVTVVWSDPELLLRRDSPAIRSVMAWWTTQLNGSDNSQTYQISQLVSQLGGPSGLCIGIESFTLRTHVTSREVLAPVRLTSKIEFALWRGVQEHDKKVRRREQIAYQSPADAKSAFDDNRLKTVDMYTPGPDHIRDSTRHSLLWLARLRNEELRSPGFFRKWYGNEEDWW